MLDKGGLRGLSFFLRLNKLSDTSGQDIAPLRVSAPPSWPAPNRAKGTMANPIQLDMFANPPGGLELPEGFVCDDLEIIPHPPKVDTNAAKKRDKRRTWYLQTILKKPKTNGETVA